MKLSRYFYVALSFIGLLVFHSCSLDEKIKDTPTPAIATSESDVKAVIQGMYSKFNDSNMFKFLGHLMLTIAADDIYSDSGSEYAPYGQRTYNGVSTAPMWNNMYGVIANANNLISVLDQLNLSDEFEKGAYGEAYFIRAFCYYYLVRLYGGVPLRLEPISINSNFYLQRNTVDEVYTQIFKDFKAASERLPVASGIVAGNLGRASKGAAQAMLAQAYLTFGDQLSLKGQSATTQFQDAALYADSVITSNQYLLLANYGDLFDIAKETGAYREVVFGIKFQTDGAARAQPAAGSEFALRFGAPNTHFVCGTPATGAGDGTFKPMCWFADYYRSGDYSNNAATDPVIDYRNEKAFFVTGFNSIQNRIYYVYPNVPPASAENFTIVTPLLAKYIDPAGKDARNNGNDFFIIRLAEVYLIKAEALNELNGPTSAALSAFNTVRMRARTVNGVANARAIPANLTTITAGNKDNFRMKIFDERGIELVGEGQRWFDLVRMRSPNSATQTMYEYQFTVRLSNTANFPRTLPTYQAAQRKYSNKNAVYAPVFNITLPKFLLFPIPTTELLQNSKFGPQNPGW